MNHVTRKTTTAFLLFLLASFWTPIADAQTDQLRVATWNISNYTGDSARTSDLQNAMFGSFNGRTFSPDVLFAQEIQSAAAASALTTVMNSAAGSGADWAMTFGSLTGTSVTSDTAMFYRTSKVNSVSQQLVAAAGGTSANPRDVWRFDFSLNNNADVNEVISTYNVHMKSGSGGSDRNRRQIESAAIRADANSLSVDHQIMMLGDFNIQSSAQDAFQTLTSASGNARGQFLDPINTLGNWNNNSQFRFVHTQDPSGQMDDRLDMILMGSELGDGMGTEYVGAFGTPYDTVRFEDTNHSYRVWGNDGTSFNNSLRITGNGMVGSSIAQSLVDVALTSGGHLPVFADLSFATTSVPEPSALALLGMVSITTLTRRRRRKLLA